MVVNIPVDCSGSASSTSSSLLERAKNHDPEAWRRLAQLYGPSVFLWCRQSGLTVDDAADVIQEVFLAVTTHLDDFQRDRPDATFRGWLWTITRNKIREEARHCRGRPEAAGGSTAQREMAQIPGPQPVSDSAEVEAGVKADLTRRALDLICPEFEPRTWQAFWRMTMDGQSAPDVATELGMTSKAIRQAKYRVLRRFRQEMEGLLD